MCRGHSARNLFGDRTRPRHTTPGTRATNSLPPLLWVMFSENPDSTYAWPDTGAGSVVFAALIMRDDNQPSKAGQAS
jgi:hypothetical protein